MKKRKLALYLSLIMFCIVTTSAPLLLVTHGQVEHAVVLIFSAEAFTPFLVFGLALIAYLIPWARKI